MKTDELKQQIAEFLNDPNHPHIGAPLELDLAFRLVRLLRSCLKHIEELEKHWNDECAAHTRTANRLVELKHVDDYAKSVGAVSQVEAMEAYADTKCAQLQSQLREREADCAAMREALIQTRIAPHSVAAKTICDKALSTTAGRELLERLQSVEKERDEWRKTAGERLDLLTKAEGRALELLERLQKAESERDRHIAKWTKWPNGDASIEPRVAEEALQPKEAK